jgi:aminomethyltransferase
MPNDAGGIVDDLLVYRLDEKAYMLVVNASNIEKDWNWLVKHNLRNAEMHNISDKTTLLAVQGPHALATLQQLTDINLEEIPYYCFRKGKFCGADNVVISNTGYTGAGGFEVYFENRYAEKIWDEIFTAGREFGILPIGLGARDTLRLEMGFCLYGQDIDDTTSPIEAGLGWITKFTKEFTHAKMLREQKEKGVVRKLVGFEMIDRGIPRNGYEILDASGNGIGRVTSGTHSPSLQKGIGMGYVRTEYSQPGSEILIRIRDKSLTARVVKPPFIKK